MFAQPVKHCLYGNDPLCEVNDLLQRGISCKNSDRDTILSFLFRFSFSPSLRLPSFAVHGDLCRRRLIPWWVAAIVAHNSLARTSPRREFCVACASQSAGLQCPRLSQMLRCGSIRSVYTWGRVYSSSSPAVALLGITVWHRSAEPLCWTRGNVGISRSKSWVL